jgi:hypothetical protein
MKKHPVITYETDIEKLREIAQELLDLLVAADAAQVAENEHFRGKYGSTDMPESVEYAIRAENAPEWIRNELDWSNYSASPF